MDKLDTRTTCPNSLRNLTFEVKARFLTQPFNKPICNAHIYSLFVSYLCLISSLSHSLYGVLDDTPSSSVASYNSSVFGLLWQMAPLEGRCFACLNVRVKPTLFIVRFWRSNCNSCWTRVSSILRYSLWVLQCCLSMWDPTTVGERNKEFFIRVWKRSP